MRASERLEAREASKTTTMTTRDDAVMSDIYGGWTNEMRFVMFDFVCDFTGTQGGNSVEVEGSFDNWQSRQTLHRSGNREFAIVMSLRPGVYQYKFIVDGQWKYAPDQPAMYDEMGNVNNVLEVQEYVPEILDSLDAFTAPASPPSSYDCAPFTSEDFAKDPPPLPPQLHMTLLNMPMVPDAPNLLPRPQHVVLNHTYCDGSKAKSGVQVLGTTHRYRSKYITVVFLKATPKQRD